MSDVLRAGSEIGYYLAHNQAWWCSGRVEPPLHRVGPRFRADIRVVVITFARGKRSHSLDGWRRRRHGVRRVDQNCSVQQSFDHQLFAGSVHEVSVGHNGHAGWWYKDSKAPTLTTSPGIGEFFESLSRERTRWIADQDPERSRNSQDAPCRHVQHVLSVSSPRISNSSAHDSQLIPSADSKPIKSLTVPEPLAWAISGWRSRPSRWRNSTASS